METLQVDGVDVHDTLSHLYLIHIWNFGLLVVVEKSFAVTPATSGFVLWGSWALKTLKTFLGEYERDEYLIDCNLNVKLQINFMGQPNTIHQLLIN